MAKQNLGSVELSDTFDIWRQRTNDILTLLESDVLTASISGDLTIGNVTLEGGFTANTVTITESLRVNEIETTIGYTDPLEIKSNVTYTSISQTPIIMQNAAGPRIRMQNNTGSIWDIGLNNNLFNSQYNIGTDTEPDLFQFNQLGRFTTKSLRIGSETNKATIQFVSNSTRTYTIPNISNADFVMSEGTQTINGAKTFTSLIQGSINGNAVTASRLSTQRTINGTPFDGTSDITTNSWGINRTLTIGNTGKTVNGASNVSWSLAEIGAVPETRTLTAGSGIATIGNLTTNRTIALTGQALAIHSLSSNGIVSRTAANTFQSRTITSGTPVALTIANGDGVSGNPTISIVFADNSEALAGIISNKVMSPLRTKAIIDNSLANTVLGINQTWQSPSRSVNTSYQNTTGKPIQLNISASVGAGNRFYELSSTGLDGSWIQIELAQAGRNLWNPVIPNNWYYRITGANITIHNWLELR